MEEKFSLNVHNKEEFPPAHTAEHLLNQTMIRMFGCERSSNAHIERKKSKISYILDHKPDRHEEKEIEKRMNELISEDMPVTYEFVSRDNIPEDVSLKDCRPMHLTSYDWYTSAIMTYAHALKACALHITNWTL